MDWACTRVKRYNKQNINWKAEWEKPRGLSRERVYGLKTDLSKISLGITMEDSKDQGERFDGGNKGVTWGVQTKRRIRKI